MLTLLHISDLHFGPPYLPTVGEAVLRSAEALRPDIVVASGDFTQRAKPAQFQAASDFLDCLPEVPKIVVPGNHDVPLYRVVERVLNPYALYRRFISQELDSVYRTDSVAIVSLNTTRPLRTIVTGRISRAQLDFCATALQPIAAGVPRIVVAHHHFAPAPDFEDEQDAIPNARLALDRFNQLEVDVILGGHLHRAYIGNSLDLYPGHNRQSGVIVVHAGTTTSRRGRGREREKNTFNVLRIDDALVRVTHYMYFEQAGGFEPVAEHVFPRRNRHYLPAQSLTS